MTTIPDTMEAAAFDKPGPPDVLHVATVPTPAVDDDSLLIKVESISLEGGDMVWRRTKADGGPNYVVGYAAGGTVVRVGANVSKFKVGDRATVFNFNGSHAAYMVAPQNYAWHIPDGVASTVGSALFAGPGTAEYAYTLPKEAPTKGQTVLVLGASGGVGIPAVQIAKNAYGCRVVGTTSSQGSLDELKKDYGLDIGIRSSPDLPPIATQVKEALGGEGVDYIIDNIGGATIVDALDALKPGGTAVLIGILGDMAAAIPAAKILMGRQTIVGCFLGQDIGKPEAQASVEKIIKRVASGQVKIAIRKEFHGLDQVAAAHKEGETRGGLGRVVITL